MGAEYFWVSASSLGDGSVVNAGNWGRIVRAIGLSHSLAGRELLWEEMRKEVNAGLPSRFSAAFVCPDFASAQSYRVTNCPYGHVYRVETVLEEPPTFVADMLWIDHVMQQPANIAGAVDVLARQEDYARSYWQGAPFPNANAAWEVVVGSDLVIRARMT